MTRLLLLISILVLQACCLVARAEPSETMRTRARRDRYLLGELLDRSHVKGSEGRRIRSEEDFFRQLASSMSVAPSPTKAPTAVKTKAPTAVKAPTPGKKSKSKKR